MIYKLEQSSDRKQKQVVCCERCLRERNTMKMEEYALKIINKKGTVANKLSSRMNRVNPAGFEFKLYKILSNLSCLVVGITLYILLNGYFIVTSDGSLTIAFCSFIILSTIVIFTWIKLQIYAQLTLSCINAA